VSWAVLGVFGDPAMLLVPALGLAAVTIAIFALGAPGRPEVLVPAFAAPPADAFTDAGVIGLVQRSAGATWVARSALVILRGVLFGLIAALAAARAAGETPSLGAAARRIARGVPGLIALAALAMGFAHTVAGGGQIEPGREAGVAGTALVAGMLFFPLAFVGAVVDGRGLLGAVRRSWRWTTRRPLGHLGLVAGYALCFGGTIRLALFGEVARPRALPITLYAFVAAFVTTIFTVALARRYALLYSDEVLAPEHAARTLRRKQRRLPRMARRSKRSRDESSEEPAKRTATKAGSSANGTSQPKNRTKSKAAAPPRSASKADSSAAPKRRRAKET
jgi:hypothetical protein